MSERVISIGTNGEKVSKEITGDGENIIVSKENNNIKISVDPLLQLVKIDYILKLGIFDDI